MNRRQRRAKAKRDRMRAKQDSSRFVVVEQDESHDLTLEELQERARAEGAELKIISPSPDLDRQRLLTLVVEGDRKIKMILQLSRGLEAPEEIQRIEEKVKRIRTVQGLLLSLVKGDGRGRVRSKRSTPLVTFER